NNGCFDTTLCTNAAIYEIPQTTSLLLTPNPFSAQATLTFQSVSPYNNMSLHVYNLFGQEVQNIFVGNNKDVIIHRNNLPSGMYFYKLIDETKALLGTGKMVVE
ncbi:MAG: T9SS type A sorting domain-containing protein, partial [Bacteroidota bacterium]